MDSAKTSLRPCSPLDADAADKLRKKAVREFDRLLCLTEKGHRPDYRFILDEICLVGLAEDWDYEDIFAMQYYLNNPWRTKTY